MHNSAISEPKTIADFDARLPNGERVSLADRLGKVVLVVNTASKCGFTPQYEGLETLWRHHRDAGFEILAFPCNQFGAQEPGSADEIASFCQVNFGLSFPLMAKVDVNGDKAEPLFDWLKAQAPGVLGTKAIKWNFTKFLIDRNGHVVRRYAPTDKPEAIEADIVALL
ncbi:MULTISPECIES: glutathione peroxidase [unclassified Novosphingobium]|uniref:glutathione peroxidase n=1 Tax=unclassified Novosphingobium TaxID=2644732 RepID=UPI00149465A8|nr:MULTISPECIES: glutathione peroxidase [unclassified Novosphingobium]MBB3357769.1 glutathione peroxidase [Novosphingobium sp. BK256]MBB3373567.1 glutathione peroxidase [Novosphingobium sp. BK280]MBB3377979.1 glutathione peroxidase [Novosphingobium sp. BK258]MBB3420236.1 glutathione peroxidase [Novosphingobium sp. BK267]MBB3447442.1 glutathione peroxidase [Novosphingobium sp. BK352]